MRLTISNQENNLMQVTVDGISYEDIDGSALANNIHAVQWYDTHGEIEYKDPVTGNITRNEEINSITNFQFAIDAWNVIRAEDLAAIALQEAKNSAYQSAYNEAITNGASEEDAMTAGQAASDLITSV
jgi:hypothetical protein